MNIGNKIKELRIKNNLTQEELAEKCGLSKNSIWNYENDKREITVETLNNIAAALGIRIIDFFVGDTVKNKNELEKYSNKELLEELARRLGDTK